MASFRGHITFSSALGFLYGGIGANAFDFDPATAILGAGICTVGGMLPDLDSDSGIPAREMFSLAGVLFPLILLRRLANTTMSPEEILILMTLGYFFIRYPVRYLFRKFTVHRGMFHSIPAMLIAGMVVYLCYDHPSLKTRLFFAVGVMVGFLSHLLLDEIYAVDLRGMVPKLNSMAGSALKFTSKSLGANVMTYGLLLLLGWHTIHDLETETGKVLLPMKAQVAWDDSIEAHPHIASALHTGEDASCTPTPTPTSTSTLAPGTTSTLTPAPPPTPRLISTPPASPTAAASPLSPLSPPATTLPPKTLPPLLPVTANSTETTTMQKTGYNPTIPPTAATPISAGTSRQSSPSQMPNSQTSNSQPRHAPPSPTSNPPIPQSPTATPAVAFPQWTNPKKKPLRGIGDWMKERLYGKSKE